MIKEYRLKRGLTQEQLAEMLDISTRHLQRIEVNICSTKIEMLIKIIQVLEIKDEDVLIKKGEAIGQAVFQKYLVADDDNAEGERLGGFGSTSK